MQEKKTDKNSYTIVFSILMVIIVGALLALTATGLKPLQEDNKRYEKMQNILSSVDIPSNMSMASADFAKYIKKSIVLNYRGEIQEGISAFDIDLIAELKNSPEKRKLPLYIAEKNGRLFYVLPLRGNGLWGPIWGYISLDDSFNVVGISLDHASETAGLGAEITQAYFQERFKGKHIFDLSGNYQGIELVKNKKESPDEGADNEVDALTGATITSNGVGQMITEGLRFYLPYLQNIKK